MTRQLILAAFAALALVFAALPQPLRAGAHDDVVQADLLPGWRRADGRHVAALRLVLKPGWKTYWRAPGDAGLPPEFDWRASSNLKGIEITWPAPHRFDQGGASAIGYTSELILPLTLSPDRAGRPIALRGDLDLGVCRDVCMPVQLRVAADLTGDVTKPDPRIAAALAARPFTAAEARVSAVQCSLSPGPGGTMRLRAEIALPQTGAGEFVVVETDNPQVWVAPAQTRRAGGRLIAETELSHVEGRAFAVDRGGLRLTVLGGRHAVDIQGCPAG